MILKMMTNCLGIHPTIISESFQRAAAAAVNILHDMSQPISLSDRTTLLQAASTSLSSKIVSQHSNLLGPMAVDSVLKVIDPKTADNVDLRDIRIIKKVGGTIEDSEMVEGLVLNQPVIKSGGGPTRIEKARIALIQFQLSPPKPDVSGMAFLLYISYLTIDRWKTKSSSTTTDRWIRSLKRNDNIFSTWSRRFKRPNAMFSLSRNPFSETQ
jgi:chaperonin GroEL (HSP60 family)